MRWRVLQLECRRRRSHDTLSRRRRRHCLASDVDLPPVSARVDQLERSLVRVSRAPAARAAQVGGVGSDANRLRHRREGAAATGGVSARASRCRSNGRADGAGDGVRTAEGTRLEDRCVVCGCRLNLVGFEGRVRERGLLHSDGDVRVARFASRLGLALLLLPVCVPTFSPPPASSSSSSSSESELSASSSPSVSVSSRRCRTSPRRACARRCRCPSGASKACPAPALLVLVLVLVVVVEVVEQLVRVQAAERPRAARALRGQRKACRCTS